MCDPNYIFDDNLTEQEQQEIDDFLEKNVMSSDCERFDDDSDDDLIYSDSDCDLNGNDANFSAIQDVGFIELRKSIEPKDGDIENGDDDQGQEMVINDEEQIAIEPNRGEKYIGQGKGDKTVWWSMLNPEEIARTESLRKTRKESKACSIGSFVEKKDAFMRIIPPSIVETIVIETNKKAKREYATTHETKKSKRVRTWQDTNVDEIYALIGILLHCGAEKANTVQAKDLFHKSNMPFYRAVMS